MPLHSNVISDDFKKGAQAMFDFIMCATANHYSHREGVKERCEMECAYAEEVAAQALEHVSPEQHAQWVTISKLNCELDRLRRQLRDAGISR